MPRDYNHYPCHDHFFGQCDDRFALLAEDTTPRRLADSDIPEIGTDCALGNNNTYIFVDKNGKDAKVRLSSILYPEHVNADWNATRGNDSEGYYYNPAYIYNKPDFEGMFNKVDEKIEEIDSKFLLDEDFIVTNTVGQVRSGTLLEKGTPLADIIKLMLTKEVGTTIKFGISHNPIDLSLLDHETKVVRQDLLEEGFQWRNIVLDGEYHVLAIPESMGIKCTMMIQGGHAIDLNEGLKESIVDGMRIYYLDLPSVGTYEKCIYKFKEV